VFGGVYCWFVVCCFGLYFVDFVDCLVFGFDFG